MLINRYDKIFHKSIDHHKSLKYSQVPCPQLYKRTRPLCAGIDLNLLYRNQTYTPDDHIPPLAKPVSIKGKGLGLQATKDLSSGELVLMSKPIGVVYTAPGKGLPSNEDLTDSIMKSPLSPEALAWISFLKARGQADESQESSIDQKSTLTDVSMMIEKQINSRYAGASPDEVSQMPVETLDRSSVIEAVRCNSYGEACEDPALADLRDVEPWAFTGLWPELALVNHSCSPNTSQLMVGGLMLLRASRPILKGDEVTTCYLGPSRFMHVAKRRALLSSEYGFHCQCNRCLIEHRLFPTRRYLNHDEMREQELAIAALAYTSPSSPSAAAPGPLQWILDKLYGRGRFRGGAATRNKLLEDTNTAVVNLEASVHDALTALSKSPEKQQLVYSRLVLAITEIEQELKDLQLSDRDKMMIKASVGGLYRLRFELTQASRQCSPLEELQSLKDWLDLLDCVARGSDMHLFVSIRHFSQVRAMFGPKSEEARLADLACAASHAARYGKGLDVELLRSLMKVRSRLGTGSTLASRISVMAWQNDLLKEKGEAL